MASLTNKQYGIGNTPPIPFLLVSSHSPLASPSPPLPFSYIIENQILATKMVYREKFLLSCYEFPEYSALSLQ